MTRMLAVLGAAGLLVAAIISAAGPVDAAAAPACSTSGLVIWLGQGNGAAGSFYYPLQLTNLSGHSCTLRGFPGVSAVNLRGRQLGAAASREHTGAVRTVTLANGRTAVATVRITDVLNFPNSRCHRVNAAGLRVYPPGQRAAKVVPFPFQACARTAVGFLSVRTVRSS